jgi:hypothetical protein
MLSIDQGQTTRTFAALVVLMIAGCGEPAAAPLESGLPPRASTNLLDIEDRPFDLWQGEAPAASVILFTRTDCPISNRYAPTVKQLCAKYEPQGVRFYLAYVDPAEEPADIRQHIKEFGYPCPALRDPDHALVAATGVTVTPEAVVFNADREIVYRGRIDNLYADFGQSRDEATTHELADALEATLAGRAVSETVTKAVGCPIGDLR